MDAALTAIHYPFSHIGWIIGVRRMPGEDFYVVTEAVFHDHSAISLLGLLENFV
jgi:hypothetical protein